MSPCRVVAFCALLATAPIGLAAQSPSAARGPATEAPLPDPLPVVAAVVNGVKIPTRNVVIAAEAAMQQSHASQDERPRHYRQMLEQLIGRELLVQEALRRDIRADDDALARAYDQARGGHRGDAEWSQYLREQRMTDVQFRTELRLQHTVSALTGVLFAEADVEGQSSEQAARRYYDQHPEDFETGERLRARHILLRLRAGGDRESLLASARDLRRQIMAGADFAALAKAHSGDVGTAGKGGELPEFGRADMVAPFSDAAFALEVGAVSEPVVTPFGVHLIRVDERLPSEHMPFDSIAQQLRRGLAQRARQQLIGGLIQRLRADGQIETFL